MAAYQFYKEENRIFRASYSVRISDEQALKVIGKLCRKYHVKRASLKVRFRKGVGGSGGRSGITLEHNPHLGLVIHEFAHVVQVRGLPPYKGTLAKKMSSGWYRNEWHDVYFMNCLMKIHAYAKSRNYWDLIRELAA